MLNVKKGLATTSPITYKINALELWRSVLFRSFISFKLHKLPIQVWRATGSWVSSHRGQNDTRLLLLLMCKIIYI